jgi:aspartyl-tRNA(Asn)/glutamyl-tRNA(Gln) amidotransferase subunit A
LFAFTSIEQYHAQLLEGQYSCLQAVEHYLSRIDSLKRLNAFVHVYASEARNQASALDEKRKREGITTRLHGVIIGIKDVIAYKDHPLSAASEMLENFHSLYSATAVERLLAEDAIIIGHLNCDEFAMGSTNENSAYGPVLNAIDESRVPGGSSGGSAVAVQAELCMLSLGSDTGGSVRQPADFCGIIGLKPTYGRISRYGLIAYASSFDQIGIFGKQVKDVALLLEIMSGPDEFDSTVSQLATPRYPSQAGENKPYRFAFFKYAVDHKGNVPEISHTIKNYISDIKRQGHIVKAVPFDLLDYVVPAYYILTTAEASSNLSRYDGVKFGHVSPDRGVQLTDFYMRSRAAFGTEVKRRIMLGTFVLSAGYYDAYFTKAQSVRRLLVDRINLVFRDFDAIILPTSPVTAFKRGEKSSDPIAMYLADIYTVMANLVGIPAISIPLFSHSNGMPYGLQLMANRFNELPLLLISNHLLENNS